MNCRECEELIVGALYGELDQETQDRFRAHIDTCADCGSLYAEMRSTLDVMSGRVREDPGQAYWDPPLPIGSGKC